MEIEIESIGSAPLWLGFLVFVAAMLGLDLGVFHRAAHVVRVREALLWSLVWIAMALLFGVGVWWLYGSERGLEFVTGYLIEKSLSIDNIFVFVVIFAALRIPPLYQHRILFWGILSALVLRAAMIFAGAALLGRFHWLIYVFGVFLVLTGIKLFVQRGREAHPEEGLAMRLARRMIHTTDRLHDGRFFAVEGGRRAATPLFLALVLIEVTDVIFAVDSIPAIFAVTRDPFIVFTSNIFAILGLRSLFFLLAGVVERFRYLKVGLAGVLIFVGLKMTAVDVIRIPPAVSLVVIAALLGAAVVASLVADARRPQGEPAPALDPPL